ncbi:MAG: hypothetical protein ABI895_17820 [Deltaproteobacteria bacterium]
MDKHRLLSIIALGLSFASRAHAEPLQRATTGVSAERNAPPPAETGESAAEAAEAGLLLPSTLPATLSCGSALAEVRTGFDGASDRLIARAAAEGNLTRFLALRLDFEHGPSMGTANSLRIGGRLQLLHSADHGVDGALALFYDPNDFREEGNVVGAILAGKRFGRLGLTGNVMFGSDPEGDDQLLELRLATSYALSSHLQLGLDTRGRYDMSSDQKRVGTLSQVYELQVLPTASLAFGSFAILAEAGWSAQRTTGPWGEASEVSETRNGVLTMLGVAAAF